MDNANLSKQNDMAISKLIQLLNLRYDKDSVTIFKRVVIQHLGILHK